MKRILAAAGAVVVFGAFGVLAYLNPAEVEFRFTESQSLRLPLGWLLVLTFVGGALLASLAIGMQRLGQQLAGWNERRRARAATRIDAWQESGAALAWEGDLDRGRALLRKAWRRDPRQPSAALALASSYMDTAEYGAARQVLEESLAQNVNDLDLRFALGEALRREGRTAEAVRMLETVRVQHPRAPRALAGLRELYRQSGRWQEAVEVQEAYLETLSEEARAPEAARLADLRLRAALAIDDAGPRVEALRQLVASERDFAAAAASLGDALVAAGQSDEACRVWERACKGRPDLALFERLLGHAATPRERERTLAWLSRHRPELDPEGVHLLLARTELAAGNLTAAGAELEAIGHQRTAAVRRCWAELYHRRGQHDEAWKLLAALADEASPSGGR